MFKCRTFRVNYIFSLVFLSFLCRRDAVSCILRWQLWNNGFCFIQLPASRPASLCLGSFTIFFLQFSLLPIYQIQASANASSIDDSANCETMERHPVSESSPPTHQNAGNPPLATTHLQRQPPIHSFPCCCVLRFLFSRHDARQLKYRKWKMEKFCSFWPWFPISAGKFVDRLLCFVLWRRWCREQLGLLSIHPDPPRPQGGLVVANHRKTPSWHHFGFKPFGFH